MEQRRDTPGSDGAITERARDADYFDERADRFRDVQRELDERACVSPARGAGAVSVDGGREVLETPAAYGTIDDVAVVGTNDLPAWYLDRVARGETLAQGLESRTLESTPENAGSADPDELLAAEEYLRFDVLVDGEAWDAYVPVPRTPAEYDASALATLRERLDGRPIERFHCARLPIRYEGGRYVPDYGARTFERWLREQGLVRWTARNGYELKPAFRVPELAARIVGLAAAGLVAGSATLGFFLLPVPELFAVWLWFVLPIAYLSSGSIAEHVFRAAFERLGPAWRRRQRSRSER
jgi:hypothetical protein